MSEWIHAVLLGVAFVGGAIALALAAYYLARLAFRAREPGEFRAVADSMMTRVGALQALILALVFAQEMAGYQRLEVLVDGEASAVADIWNDAGRYGEPPLVALRAALREYLGVVVGEEWDRIGQDGTLSPEAWAAWDRAYRIILDLPVGSDAQTALRDNMLSRIHAVASARDQRAKEGYGTPYQLFWIASLSGLVVIAIGHLDHAPKWQNLGLMALFAGYTGLILFLIFAFSNPFQDPAALKPVAMERLLDAMDQQD